MTSGWDKFRLLMWKNWVLQKRHKLRTVLEILIPVVFVSLLVLVRSLVEPKLSPVLEFPEFKASKFTFEVNSIIQCKFPSAVRLSYSPTPSHSENEDQLKKLIEMSMKYMIKENFGPQINRIMQSKNQNEIPTEFNANVCLANLIKGGDFPLRLMRNPNLEAIYDWLVKKLFLIKGYPDAKSLERQLLDPTENDTSLCGIQFDDSLKDMKNLSDWPSNISLTMRFPAQLRRVNFPNPFLNWKTNLLYPILQVPGPRGRDEKYGGWPSYVREGFMPISHSIFHEINKELSNNTKQPNLWIRRYPHPEFLNDDLLPALQGFISLIIMLTFNYTCINTIRSIASEKEKQLKEVMKIMGLSNWLHWTAWFVKSFMYLLFSIILIVILLKVEWYKTDLGVTGYSVFTYTPWHLLFVFMMLYVTTSICFCFMISTFFSKANTAATVAGLTWFISYMPYMFLANDKVLTSITTRLLSCLASNTAMAFGFHVILMNEATAQGMQWSKLFTPLTADDPFVMGHVMLMMIVDSLLYLLIALYVEQVFPGSYGVPEPWYFPVSKVFWRSICRYSSNVEDISSNIEEVYNDTLEPDPKGLNVGINIINLTKVFKKKPAVQKLNLRIFEDQITVLLGHNGAGKTTTMSMLTGVFPPTTGTAIVAGHDIRKDITGVRDSLGLCPQHNVLFSDLTVAEHIYFYARLKGMSGYLLDQEVESYTRLLGLEDKSNVKSSALSGGMQRRLSVGTALCGGSRVVLLDEPSSGMDPSARRDLWDLLHKEKKGRTMILTTHFMDEAEILGERVAILSGGKLRCVGSPFYLKKKLGIGYRLTAARQPSITGHKMTPSAPITNILVSHIPEVKLYTDIGSEISYILPEESSRRFEPMLQDLENKQEELGIIGFGISASTLEEVFMRVGADDKFNDDDQMIYKPDTNGSITDRDNELINNSQLTGVPLKYSGIRLIKNQFKAMLLKKFVVFLRSWLLCALQTFLPIFFISVSIIVVRMYQNPIELPSKTLDLATNYKDSISFLTENVNPNNSRVVDAYKDYFEKSDIKQMKLLNAGDENMTELYLKQALIDMPSMRVRNLAGATIEDEKVTAWFSNFPYHDLPVSVMLAENSILKAHSPNSTFTLINHPLPFSIKSRFELLMYGDGGSFQIAFNLGFSMAFVSSFFLLFYIKENITRSKLLQLASGVSPLTLWNVALLWDMLWMMVISGCVCITLAGFQQNGLATSAEIGRVFVVLVIFGWGMLPIQYLCSNMFQTPSTGFSRMCFFNFFTGLATFLTVEVLYAPGLDLEHIADILHQIFLIFPHYALCGATKNLNQASITLKTCQAFCDVTGIPNCTVNTFCSTIKYCCISETPFFEWTKPGIGAHVTYMLVVGVVLYGILIAREYKLQNYLWTPNNQSPIMINDTEEDSDVVMEKNRVASLSPDTYSQFNLLCKDMTKYYGNFLAVNQLSLAVTDSECFGLLGMNGAGKTTTFKMLTGDLRLSSGGAWVKGHSVNTQMKKVYQNIGYCPQFDALLEEMTGRETLRMYSLLRGIPHWRQERFILEISKKLGFLKHLDKEVGQYSGGNKRKLSTSIALLGDPHVVYLDEPTTGMDPAAKRLVWNAIAGCNCVILTSHSMEECEALCSRLAIMVNGRPKCLGSPQHLKTKFSQGYTLIVKLMRLSHPRDLGKYPDVLMNPGGSQVQTNDETKKESIRMANSMFDFNSLHTFLKSNFPDAKVVETYQGLITYHLPDTSIRWSKIFGIMESAKEDLGIEDYSIGQTSLEQIFLQFTKDQKSEKED